MATFTPAQLEVINETGKNITVSASAGSGKTTVLIERIMKRIMKDGVPLDRILAMTFTEAAASEMKKRLAKVLNEELNAGNYDPKLINEQLIKLQKTQITTISAFCLDIIQEHYAQIGFDIERCRNVIMKEEAQELINEAIETVIKEFQNDEAYMKLRMYLSHKANDQAALKEAILKFTSIFDNNTLDNVLTNCANIYEAKRISAFPSKLKELLVTYLSFKVESIIAELDSLNSFLSYYEDDNATLISNAATLKSDKLRFALTHLKDEAFSYPLFVDSIKNAIETKIDSFANDDNIKNIRESIHKHETALINELYDEEIIINDLHEDYDMVVLLLKMSHAYLETFRRIKAREGVMDFADMEYYALEILETSKDVQNYYKEHFIDIMVDEFQDSSNTQDKLIGLISNGTNVFRVGDVKQSIYGFRKAVPELLKSYIEHPTENDSVKFLQHNFRSNEQIITYVNTLFRPFMNIPSLTGNFNDEDFAHVGNMDNQACKDTCIEFHSLLSDIFSDDEVEENSPKNELRANYIADLIAKDKLKSNGKWNDYVILLRGHTHKKLLKDALDARNIPFHMSTTEGFYKSTVIQNVVSYLRFIIEPHVDLHFIAVASSAFYNLSDDELVKIYLDRKEANLSSYYAYAKQSNHEVLNKMLEDLKAISKLSSLQSILNYIYTINDFYDQKCNRQERNNLDFLLEKTVAFDAKSPNAIHKYVDFIEQCEDEESSEALSRNQNEDVVQAVTIHASKGLQYEKVIYWGKELYSASKEGNIVYDENSTIFLNHLDLDSRLMRKSLLRRATIHRQKLAQIEEEIRLIYVALTRAKSKLYLVATLKEKELETLKNKPLNHLEFINSCKYLNYIYKLSQTMPEGLVNFVEAAVDTNMLVIPKATKPRVTLSPLANKEHEVLQFKASNHESVLYEWRDDEINFASVGTLTHELLAKLDLKATYSINALKELANKINPSLANLLNYHHILAYLNNPFTQELANHKITYELPFITLQNNQIAQGYMDMVIEKENEVIIVDYKSDRGVSREELIERYQNQLSVYATAMSNTTDKKVSTYIYSLTLEEYINL